MGVDYSGFAFPKARQLRVEEKREKRLTDEREERGAKGELSKAGRRCVVPGCLERSNLHVHHLVRRSQSKAQRWQLSNLCYLCAAHHALEHAGKIHVERNEHGELVVTGERKYLEFKL